MSLIWGAWVGQTLVAEAQRGRAPELAASRLQRAVGADCVVLLGHRRVEAGVIRTWWPKRGTHGGSCWTEVAP